LSVVLDRAEAVLGRDQFPDPQVSRRHLKVCMMGPCVEVASLGRNDTLQWQGGRWTALPTGQPVLLAPGDLIRLGRFDLRLAA